MKIGKSKYKLTDKGLYVGIVIMMSGFGIAIIGMLLTPIRMPLLMMEIFTISLSYIFLFYVANKAPIGWYGLSKERIQN